MIIDTYRSIGETPYIRVGEADLLRDMDDAGVDMAVVAPMGRLLAVDFDEGNRIVAQMQRRYPDRVIGFGTVNPWVGRQRVFETVRSAVAEGLRGIAVNPAIQGVAAHSPLMHPVAEAVIEHDIPLYIHSGTPVFGLPLQITFLAESYPDAKIIMGHMGGADFYIDMQSAIARAPGIYLETSLTCHVAYVEEGFREAAAGHVLFGSDYPFSATKAEMLKVQQTTIGDDEKAMIFGANAARLFRLKGGDPS